MSNTIIKLENALFKGLSTAKGSPSVFHNPISLEIKTNERWAIIGTYKAQMMKVLASQYMPEPALSRTYPFLNKSIWPQSAIQFLEFKGALPTAHLAARYEFFKDEFDETTKKFVIGNVNNNSRIINEDLVHEVFEKLKLQGLENRWVMGLSNGQTRRARLARALVREPKLLLVDDPFLGLDPTATSVVSEVLGSLAPNPHVVLGLRYQDEIPDWITHIAVVDETGIITQGEKSQIKDQLEELKSKDLQLKQEQLSFNKEKLENIKKLFQKDGKIDYSIPLLEFNDISVAYRGQPVIENLNWKVHHGERWHVRGDNGTGKSTLLALITAEHPQSWNSKIIMNGEPRETGRHNFFDINENIGFASPELHVVFPQSLTAYEAISTGYLVSSFVPPKNLSQEKIDRINTFFKEFNLESIKHKEFRDLGISDQKLILFIRSLIRNPDLLILDEALSVMDDARIEQCKELLRHYPGTILSIGHLDSEVPDTDRYIRLLGPGKYEIGLK
ncbi:Ribose import ATP-binding protein [Wickerhamomyces ciferrii]|uniref:Ribose import ATP-binding protein n=1 Tax=Wickerhamomyces ciferrii (strain ATCC 14091 / BCRC 22168 / CBS 111 / JCM 3599 / NBRC 0793 / NRRL Y-1031 F-60-10) TaxID=1206466 RepID=K0KIE0_WICCF|nr:Ribose import ATP-binding protein [Wickerhamomyces ciferrii]CCH40923.1 Ribose import ATP-binding protein [Wickerhamomyces ciferrii]